MTKSGAELVAACRKELKKLWDQVINDFQANPELVYINNEEMRTAINRSINSKTKTYRYVLPTQLIAKTAEPTLDCRCLQKERGGEGAFDARTIAHNVTVEFDSSNHKVLGGAPEPYVNNPLRYPEVSSSYRKQQKDKIGWDELCFVLDNVESSNNRKYTKLVLRQILLEVLKRIETVQIVYSIPVRISLRQTTELINHYISIPSGGARNLAITAALFSTIGRVYNIFSDVKRADINAADASTGMVSDIECYDVDGDLAVGIEVKDTELKLIHIETKLPNFRASNVKEIFYVISKGLLIDDEEKIKDLVNKEYASGQNIYIIGILHLCRDVLALVGEKGRRIFLEEVCDILDEYDGLSNRKHWAELLAKI